VQATRARLDGLVQRLAAAKAAQLRAERKLVAEHRQRLADMLARTRQTLRLQLQRRQERLDHVGQLLTSLSYQGVLARGYVLVLDEAGQPLNSADQVHPAADYRLRFADGEAQVVGKSLF
jgi:exodeoxyribonuclease VII large subunit